MIEGLYRVAAGMSPKMTRMEIMSNNLANIDTTGFKRDRAFMEDLSAAQVRQAADGSSETIIKQYIDFNEGGLRQTSNPLDVAIQGRGFFELSTPDGPKYTRSGNFKMSLDGSIVSSQGFEVMGTNGKLQLPDIQRLTSGSVQISESGEVTVDKQSVGHIKVVDFKDYTQLTKSSDSMFIANPGADISEGPGPHTTVRQGYLEESNVDGLEEMVAMVELNRSFESDQKALQAQDATLGQIMEVGKL
jgi:flagellar basal-body rod protein FlgG